MIIKKWLIGVIAALAVNAFAIQALAANDVMDLKEGRNVRSGPGLSYTAIKSLSTGSDVVTVDDNETVKDSYGWWYTYYPDSTYGYSKKGYIAAVVYGGDVPGEYTQSATAVTSSSSYISYTQACPLSSSYKTHTGTVYATGSTLKASSCNPRAWQIDAMGNPAYVDGMKVNAIKK